MEDESRTYTARPSVGKPEIVWDSPVRSTSARSVPPGVLPAERWRALTPLPVLQVKATLLPGRVVPGGGFVSVAFLLAAASNSFGLFGHARITELFPSVIRKRCAW